MRRLLICLALVTCSGCSLLKSRYAMDDPVYAEKYAEGAERSDVLGKAKQAFDARHAEGLSGRYVSGGAQYQATADEPFLGAELGLEHYGTSWASSRAALAANVGDGAGRIGVDLGARLQTPSRIAPFAGVGLFLGAWPHKELADMDNIDNDDDGWIDEWGEKDWEFDHWLAAAYPEIGIHAWLNGSWRLTAYGRYFVTTEGRAHDDWLIGGQITAFSR